MRRFEVNLPQTKWGTIKSKYQPESNYLSNDEFTVGSSNFLTNVTGAIEKRPKDTLYNNTPLTAPGKDAFEAIFSNGVHHLLFMDDGTLKYTSGDNFIYSVSSGFTANGSMEYTMYQNRVYMGNGIDTPRVYDLTSTYGGVSYTPPQIKNMGAQAPGSAITFAADTAGGSVPAGGHTYKSTFLYYGSEESNGGPASALHTVVNPNNTVNLTGIPIGGYGVTARKIYRDNGDGNYLLIGTVSNNTATTFTDTVSAGTTAIPTFNNTPPVFSYIVLNLSRLFVAGVSGTPTSIYWSSPGLPDIFDPDNSLICNPKDAIQALAVYQGTVYVLNRHSFGQILGNTDDTFYYQEFPGTVGCTDTRSIQVRTINGVPVLVWLSDRGLYAFNGSSVEYISDPIEDEVNLNIQQTSFVSGSNTQSTQADFQAGFNAAGGSIITTPGAIDLNTDPGTVQTINPFDVHQSQADWQGGSQVSNLALVAGDNRLKPITQFRLAGSFPGIRTGGMNPSTASVAMTTFADFTGAGNMGSQPITSNNFVYFAQKTFPIVRSGTLTSVTTNAYTPAGAGTFRIVIWADGGSQPGSILATSGNFSVTSTSPFAPQTFVFNTSLALTAGQIIYIGVQRITAPSNTVNFYQHQFVNPLDGNARTSNDNVTWGSGTGRGLSASFTFTQTAVANSGTWTSATYNTDSTSINTAWASLTASFPNVFGGTKTMVFNVDHSDDGTIWDTIFTYSTRSNLVNSNFSPSKRYYRMRIALTTTDDRETDTITLLNTLFINPSTGVTDWISETMEMTTDVTVFNDPVWVSTNVGGGTVTFTIATATTDAGWGGTGNGNGQFGPWASMINRRYFRLKASFTQGASGVSFATSVTATWTVAPIYVSPVIDTALAPPSGWGIFQFASTLNGGTLTVEMRSSASLPGLAAATYYPVTNGNFPPISVVPLQFAQWRLVFTATANQVPVVDSVTVNWFLGNNTAPIRVASLFFNKTYYLAAAELGYTYNNVVIIWDQEGNWRLWRDVNINALTLFFNQPFYLDAVRTNIYQWLIALDGTGDPITMDVRTKAFDLADYDHLKNPRSLRVMGLNTGTTIHAYFSVDRGVTWVEMLNSHGLPGYTTTTDGSKFYEYFVPNYDIGEMVAGVTIMFRVTSTDAYPCEILSLKPVLSVRAGKYLGYAI